MIAAVAMRRVAANRRIDDLKPEGPVRNLFWMATLTGQASKLKLNTNVEVWDFVAARSADGLTDA